MIFEVTYIRPAIKLYGHGRSVCGEAGFYGEGFTLCQAVIIAVGRWLQGCQRVKIVKLDKPWDA